VEAASLLPEGFPFVEFPRLPSLMQWEQGEHATLIAPTGQGKTTCVRELIPRTPAIRRFVMVLATKKRDKVLKEFTDYQRMTFPQTWAERVIIYPPFPRDADAMLKAQRETFRRALNEAYQAGGWTVYADEVRYLSNDLRLAQDLQRLWMQGRSLGVSLIASTQRPRHIPLEAYDQPTHLFFWRDTDMGNVQRISEISGTVDRRRIIERVPQLPRYQFIYANTRTGEIVESKVRL
jgi:hypothetical protein